MQNSGASRRRCLTTNYTNRHESKRRVERFELKVPPKGNRTTTMKSTMTHRKFIEPSEIEHEGRKERGARKFIQILTLRPPRSPCLNKSSKNLEPSEIEHEGREDRGARKILQVRALRSLRSLCSNNSVKNLDPSEFEHIGRKGRGAQKLIQTRTLRPLRSPCSNNPLVRYFGSRPAQRDLRSLCSNFRFRCP